LEPVAKRQSSWLALIDSTPHWPLPNFPAMPVRSVKTSSSRKAVSSPKHRKPSLSAERLERLIAELVGVRPIQVTVRSTADGWDAILIASHVGNAERRAAFWSIVQKVRSEFDLEAD
jgi:hypothetical protein